jgi:copper chaperone
MNTIVYIQNLKCGGCASTITKNIAAIEQVSNVIVTVDAVSYTHLRAHETN